MNTPRSKKGTHKHKYKCALSVRMKQLHTPGKMTLGPGKTTPGGQDIWQNDRNSCCQVTVYVAACRWYIDLNHSKRNKNTLNDVVIFI